MTDIFEFSYLKYLYPFQLIIYKLNKNVLYLLIINIYITKTYYLKFN